MRFPLCKILVLLCTALWLIPETAAAAVKLPALISDNMVLQSGVEVPIWGTANPSERVSVTLGSAHAATTADNNGRWKVQIGPLQPGGPLDMTVAGTNTIVVHDVLVGEVWVCSGQSNMEFHVGPGPGGWESGVLHYKEEIASAHYPEIRMFTVDKTVAGQPQREVNGRWEVASPVTVGHFSAVGYFFGLNLFKSLHVPVGLIHSSWGGTPAESWTTLPTLESNPDFKSILDRWQEQNSKFSGELGNFTSQFDKWKEASEQAETQGNPIPAPPKTPADPRSNPWRPAGLFNGMIAPLIPYRIKGVIWYQGESNADRAYQYRRLFPDMIRDWRRAWGEGDFPFLFVQLASFQDLPPSWSFPLLREAQLMTLSLPETAMVVTADIGSPADIHPRNKQEVGRRLALAAGAVAYQKKLVYSGPIYSSMNIEGNKIRLHFSHVGGGLVASGGYGLGSFEIAGADHKFHDAHAEIEGDTVVVQGDGVPKPVAVRYAWHNYPICHLFNQEGLPASPFRTDDWQE